MQSHDGIHLKNTLVCVYVLTVLLYFTQCGLPGGIDYGLLALVKFGVIEKLTEKKINRLLNLVVRTLKTI